MFMSVQARSKRPGDQDPTSEIRKRPFQLFFQIRLQPEETIRSRIETPILNPPPVRSVEQQAGISARDNSGKFSTLKVAPATDGRRNEAPRLPASRHSQARDIYSDAHCQSGDEREADAALGLNSLSSAAARLSYPLRSARRTRYGGNLKSCTSIHVEGSAIRSRQRAAGRVQLVPVPRRVNTTSGERGDAR